MKTVIYGQVVKERYIFDLDWEDNDWDDIYHNTDKYIRIKSHADSYEEIKNFELKENNTYRILHSEFDASEMKIIHYTDYVIRIISPNEAEREERYHYAKEQARKVLEQREKRKEEEKRKSVWKIF